MPTKIEAYREDYARLKPLGPELAWVLLHPDFTEAEETRDGRSFEKAVPAPSQAARNLLNVAQSDAKFQVTLTSIFAKHQISKAKALPAEPASGTPEAQAANAEAWNLLDSGTTPAEVPSDTYGDL